MRTISAIGFDLDGTLFDHAGSASIAAGRFAEHLGVVAADEFRECWFEAEHIEFERWRSGEITFEEQRRGRLRRVLPAFGLPVPEEDAALDALYAEFLFEYRAAWEAFPDSAPALRLARSHGLRIGVLTNGSEAQQFEKLREIGLIELIDVVCTSEGIGVQKPDRRAFETLADRLGVPADECVFIGDHPEHDVAGAIAAGMRGVLVERTADDATALLRLVEDALSGLRPRV